jgi:hypothetical protein
MQHSLALAPTQPVAFVNPIPLHALAPIAITPPVQVPTLTISPSPKLAVPLSALSPIYNQQQL